MARTDDDTWDLVPSADDPHDAFNLTIKKNSVAVVTDGSQVLGLGNAGPLASQ